MGDPHRITRFKNEDSIAMLPSEWCTSPLFMGLLTKATWLHDEAAAAHKNASVVPERLYCGRQHMQHRCPEKHFHPRHKENMHQTNNDNIPTCLHNQVMPAVSICVLSSCYPDTHASLLVNMSKNSLTICSFLWVQPHHLDGLFRKLRPTLSLLGNPLLQPFTLDHSPPRQSSEH